MRTYTPKAEDIQRGWWVVDAAENCDDGDAISNGDGSCVADCSGVQSCGDVVCNGTEDRTS